MIRGPRTHGAAALLFIAGTLWAAPGTAQGSGASQGLTYLRAGDYDEAVRVLRPLARGGDPDALTGWVTALRETGEYDRAVEAAAAGVDGDVTGARALLGRALLDVGQVPRARAVLTEGAAEGGSPGAQARVELGILEYTYGDREEAYRIFDGFIDYYNDAVRLGAADLTAVGRALIYLSHRDYEYAQDALKALDEANQAGPLHHGALVAVGNLFLERYDAPQAAESFREILSHNPSHAEALLGLGAVANLEGGGDPSGALEAALETNPKLAGAHTLLSRVRLMDGSRAEALEEADRALDVNPVDLEAIGTKAAIHYLAGEDAEYRRLMDRARTLSPAPTAALLVLSQLTADHRKYQDALAFARESAQIDPASWSGWGLMGLNQVRLGQVEEGRANLEKAFAGDPFNPWFKNTLDLLDTFAEYRTVDSEHFSFMLHESEADLLGPYMAPVAERAYSEMSRRYGYTPPRSIRVEVYARHADFSVRTVGLVGIGALGVSFGPALAMDSPSARSKGEFNWASTLWHEIAHSFHLGASEHEVPRWFSEGLAVHEQRKGNPTWGHQASPGFIQSLASGELRPVSELDRGFSHPRHPAEVIHSYYEASLVFELIEREHGFQPIVDMLTAYREGASNEEAFQRALGLSLSRFDEDFEAFLKDRFAAAIRSVGGESATPPPPDLASARRAVATQPGRFLPRMSLGAALFDAGELDGAADHFEAALELFPQYGGPDGPHWYLGRIREAQDDLPRAIEHYRALLALNESHYDGRLVLAGALLSTGDRPGAVEVLKQVPYIHPYEIADREGLAELMEEESDLNGAILERQAVLALDPVDRPTAHFRLARAYHRKGDRTAARRAVLAALELAPNYEAALELLLELRSGTEGR